MVDDIFSQKIRHAKVMIINFSLLELGLLYSLYTINPCNSNHGAFIHTGGWPLIGIPDTSSTPWSINSTSFLYEKAIGGPALFGFKLFFNAVTQSRSKYVLHVSSACFIAPCTTTELVLAIYYFP